MSNSIPPGGDPTDETPGLPWESLGKHRFYRTGDTYYLNTHGELNAAEIRGLLDGMLDQVRSHGAVLLMIDARGGFTMSSEARKVYAEWAREKGFQPGSSAIVGASSTTWGVVRLITNAVALIMRHNIPVRFFKHRSEAMAWLDSERQRWRVELRR